jgi:hypothetical protein
MDEVAGFFIAIVLVVLFSAGYGIYRGCNPDPPKPCSDYAYKLSRLPGNAKVAVCDRWTDMEMKVTKEGILGGHMVRCTCTAKSVPHPR